MRASREIIVIQGVEATDLKYAEQLPSYSFPTKVCYSLHGFRRVRGPRRVFAGVVVGRHADPVALATGLRCIDPHMWIVFMHPAATRQQRIAALAAGVDICLQTTVDTAELAAALQALVRRERLLQDKYAAVRADVSRPAARARAPRATPASGQGEGAGAGKPGAVGRRSGQPPTKGYEVFEGVAGGMSARGSDLGLADVIDALARPRAACEGGSAHSTWGWTLSPGGRRLCCRHGRCMPLTPTERIFVARLLLSAGRPVHRAQASDGGGLDVQAGEPDGRTERSVDVLVSRLRQKALRHGLFLPIRAVRGWGYLFAPGAAGMPPARVDRDGMDPRRCCEQADATKA